tara:strand:- start:2235 stop:2861 length:627 start_codon:yes stop_codon:yes gene_type:complete
MALANNSPFYLKDENRGLGAGSLPLISMGLDSVRAYQFEIFFKLPPFNPAVESDAGSKITLAAKQVSQVGMTIEDIEVHRVNDKVFYPGKASPEELTVTFDNFYQENGRVAEVLWQWFSWIYDPTSGKLTEKSVGSESNWKSQSVVIVHLDAQGQPQTETRLYGVYPKSWKTAEFNYATNEFHTIEMVFRYDFMEHVEKTVGVGGALG